MPLRQKMLNPRHLRSGSSAALDRVALDDDLASDDARDAEGPIASAGQAEPQAAHRSGRSGRERTAASGGRDKPDAG